MRSGREFPVRLCRSLLYPVPLSKGRRETDITVITPLAFSTAHLLRSFDAIFTVERADTHKHAKAILPINPALFL